MDTELELDERRPNVAGDLPTLFRAAPMFRRALAGYDRFQVDTYVQWAEEELAAAERQLEHLTSRHLHTRAALDEALLAREHSAGGVELLEVSRRIGSLLAAAADEAAGIRADATADRAAVAERARRVLARAETTLADAESSARRLAAEAAAAAVGVTDEAHQVLAEAEGIRRTAHAEAMARRQEVQELEQRAAESVARLRQDAAADAAAALLRARAEVVAMLDTGRTRRQRADEEAAATRDRLDRLATDRRAALLAEVASLERRAAALRQEVGPPARPESAPPGSRLLAGLRRLAEGPARRSGVLRTP
jgi:hypothetical protein